MDKTLIKLIFSVLTVSTFLILSEMDTVQAEPEEGFDGDLGSHTVGGKTDDDTVEREAEQVSYDGFSPKERQAMEADQEKHEFEAEVGRLMGLIINSLYSNKEIFLREVISNASDALDKIRYFSLTDRSVLGEGDHSQLRIRVKADPATKSLTIEDTGIGMTREDLMKNLGSIASSGTKRFVEGVLHGDEGGDSSGLIGQFGVGFYSVFLVADEVTVTTKNNDDDQYVWVSDAAGGYTLSKDPRGNTLGRGTRIVLKLKDDALEFLDESTLEGLIRKYSEFITFPIYLWTTDSVDEEVDLTEEEIEEAKAAARAAKEDEEDEEEVSEDAESEDEAVEEEEEIEVPTTKTVTREVAEYTLINSNKPIWTRAKEDIDEQEYKDFFKAMTKTDEDPLAYIHFSAEGEVDFRSILYIPEKAPADMYTNYGAKAENVKLYVRRVFITDDFEDILPKYLSFVKGMVDSDNLPLNVSREMLQQHKMLKTIKKKLTRKALEMVKKLQSSEDEEVYEKFWKEFGTAIKLGLIEDTANRTKIAKLLRFKSSKSGEGLTSLEDYVERMKDTQKNIYYLAGESLEQVQASPYLEVLLKRGLECLYLVDPVDEYAINSLPEFDGKKLMNVGKEGLEFEEDAEEDEDFEAEFAELLVWLKDNLSDKIDKAAISKRLYTSPCALVTGYFGYTPNMERIVKAQALSNQDASSSFMMNSKKNMEINPRHPIIQELNRRVSEDAEDPLLVDLAYTLFDTAALSSGYGLGDTAVFANRVHKFILQGLDLDPNAEADKNEKLEALAEQLEAEEEAEEAEEEDAEEEADVDAEDTEKDEL